MALFTNKADAGLSRLTRFYQLELPEPPDEEEDVDGWYDWGLHLMEGEESELAAFVDQERTTFSNALYYPLSPPGEDSGSLFNSSPEAYRDLGEFYIFLKRLMQIAADNKAPSEEEEGVLNILIQHLLRPPKVLWRDLSRANFKQYLVLEFDGINEFDKIIKRPLLEDFLTALRARSLVRCQECQSVFPKREDHKEQRFCSHRCRHRVGSRRRYQRKPENEHSDTGNH
jgi:hypothetical protein